MIRKKHKTIIVILSSLIILTLTFTGCSNTSTNTSKKDTKENTIKSTTILGRVKSVDGNKVKIDLVTKDSSTDKTNTTKTTNDNSNNKSQENSQKEDKQSSSNSSSNKDNNQSLEKPQGNPPEKPPEKPSSDSSKQSEENQQQKNLTDSNKPENMQPPTNGGGPSTSNSITYKTTGKKQNVEIDDESLIKVEKGDLKIDGSLDDITIGGIISVKYDDNGDISNILVKSTSSYTGGASTGSIVLSGKITSDGKTMTSENKTVSSTKSNENGYLSTNKGNLTIKNATINKSGDTTSEEDSNFYGVNAGVLASNQSEISISDSNINTSSEGSNGIFSTGAGSIINVSNVNIKTTKNSSRGLDATYNGTIIANKVTIDTKGAHCAGLANDRGEGTIHANNVTVTTAGEGSPGIYSTGTITAKNSKFTSTGSQAAVIEGKNSITLTDCTLSGAVSNGVMLYQSFSGDAGEGTCYFNMKGGSITANEGPMFYITNTSAEINLENATLNSKNGELLNSATGRWGNNGSNGGNVTLNAKNQTLKGNVTCDKISTVVMNLKEKTSLEGCVNKKNTAKKVKINLDKTSTWNVTDTSYITILKDSDKTLSNIKDNGNTIYYDSSNSQNSWLEGKTINLSDGGVLKPM